MTEKRKVVVSASEELMEETGSDEALVAKMVDEDFNTEEDDFEPISSVEDLPDEEEIWPDGPTAGQIKIWKKEHGDVYVTSISFDKHIAWRPLSRIEYKNLVRKMEQLVQSGQLSTAEANLWNEEAIAELCILFPSYDIAAMTREMAGLPSLISQEVLEASGFVALEVRQL
jgi:hypothetical protein